MQTQKISYKRHRYPPQIIAHVVWLSVRGNLSLREVEELMLERGVDVSYETIRRWTVKFGPRSPTFYGDGSRALAMSGIWTNWS